MLRCLCLLLITFPGFGCCFLAPRVWHTAEEDLSLPAADVERLLVGTHNGDIDVVAVPESQSIEVHIKKKAGGSDDLDAQACMDAIQIQNAVSERTRELGWEWAEEKRNGWQASVSFEIRLPPGFGIEIRTHNGSLFIQGMTEPCLAVTHNGSIKVERLVGDVDLESHNGAIDVDSRSSRVKIKTHNSRITAHLSDVPFLEGAIVTHNGSIRLKIDGEPSTSITCRTHNGSVAMNRPVRLEKREERLLIGVIGEGGHSLEVETHNGSVTVD